MLKQLYMGGRKRIILKLSDEITNVFKETSIHVRNDKEKFGWNLIHYVLYRMRK